jgi:(p)ppGpp synthase/HD superfamily hydrolase
MKKLTKEKNKIIETQFKSKKNEIECIFLIEIKNIKEIEKIIKEIDEIPGIKETKRETN